MSSRVNSFRVANAGLRAARRFFNLVEVQGKPINDELARKCGLFPGEHAHLKDLAATIGNSLNFLEKNGEKNKEKNKAYGHYSLLKLRAYFMENNFTPCKNNKTKALRNKNELIKKAKELEAESIYTLSKAFKKVVPGLISEEEAKISDTLLLKAAQFEHPLASWEVLGRFACSEDLQKRLKMNCVRKNKHGFFYGKPEALLQKAERLEPHLENKRARKIYVRLIVKAYDKGDKVLGNKVALNKLKGLLDKPEFAEYLSNVEKVAIEHNDKFTQEELERALSILNIAEDVNVPNKKLDLPPFRKKFIVDSRNQERYTKALYYFGEHLREIYGHKYQGTKILKIVSQIENGYGTSRRIKRSPARRSESFGISA